MKFCLSTLLLIGLTSFCISASAQKISGKVLRETGTGAGHVSVAFKNKSNKVFSEPDGTFSIVATKLPDTLVFSSPSFETYTVVVTEKTLNDSNFEVVLLSKREKISTKDIPIASGKVSGKVINDKGETVPFATISETGTKNAVKADADGYFSIATHPGSAITIDAAGQESRTVVPETTPMTIVLVSTGAMKEVVITTAMGVKRRAKEIGYSSTTLKASDLGSYTTSTGSSSSYLSGKAAGLSVSTPLNSYATLSNKKLQMLDSIPKSDALYKSHLLTAGEINDFNKWKMWEDFQEGEFKTWSEHWNVFPKQRYSVQLQNKNHAAVIGQKVFLINKKTNDTVWSAITDNTGKAELWAELDGKKTEGQYIISCKGATDIVASSFENGVNRIELNDPCSLSNTIDIAFVVDATGSMGDEIDFLKVELEDVIRSTFSKYSNLDLNVGSVFYRDAGDEYVSKHIDFQTELLKVLNFIKLQRAAGGGDTPESVNIALHSALDSLSWHENARTKMLFLVLDAPPHDETKTEMFELIKKAASMGIRVVPVVCSGADKSTEFIMRSIALATNGDYVFLTDDSGAGLPHIKPTTDAFNVELFTNLLQRLITQMVFANKCNEQTTTETFKTTPENIEKLKIYPNPTQGNLKIESTNYLKEIFITDFTGKILMRIATNDKQRSWNINIAQYPNATYLVKYITQDDQWGAEKVVLIH